MRFLPKNASIYIILFSILTNYTARAQNQTSNYGKEFRFAFLENYGNLDKVSFVTSLSTLPDTVVIRVGTDSFYFRIYKNKDTIINFTKLSTPNAFQFGPNKSIRVTATHPISLYAMNHVQNSSDIACITPSERIPGNPVYFVNTFRGEEAISRSNNSLFTVVAIDDSCLINIMPTADSKYNLIKNTPFSILLRKGQIFSERAADSQSFSGTKIWNSKGCKRFSVFEGAICSQVDYKTSNCKGCDHLFNQSRPLQYLGKAFTTLPFSGLNGGYYYQIVATENNTTVLADGLPLATLNAGEVFAVDQKSNVSVCIESDKLISLVQLMKSGGCNGQTNLLGNPSLMSVIPDNQTTTAVGFSFPSTANISLNPGTPSEYYVGISCPKGSLYKLRLNGAPVDSARFSSNCHLAVGNIKLNGGMNYQLSSEIGFIAYIYAYGDGESYATPIASGYESSISKLLLEANNTSTCDSFKRFVFKGQSDSIANYNWIFGDGTFATGDSVVKQYPKTGNYLLKLAINYPNNFLCKADTLSKLIKVHKRPYFSLGPDSNLCQGVFFQISPVVEPNVSYTWHNNSHANLMVVSKNQLVWLTLTDSNQCKYTDSILLTFINCDSNSIIIPNVFTPGRIIDGTAVKDDINDLFEVQYTGFDRVKGQIFNRWGQEIYTFEAPQDSYWNGSIRNDLSKPCPSGTYYYIIEFVNSSTKQSKSFNGVVQLIR